MQTIEFFIYIRTYVYIQYVCICIKKTRKKESNKDDSVFNIKMNSLQKLHLHLHLMTNISCNWGKIFAHTTNVCLNALHNEMISLLLN